ncbi:hypothetical protein ASG11_10445 [Sphingomonas sp. Leaf357]|uniref:hypothetical protein n=1 Tax=Sphingomonas sp. Leaf357 TaxID=1736350 RepID=UPI0006FD7B1B|nr:hypothetical protein [Sphingomonas sp. Leaf357]KQS04616.1 hypothetical protein ASG11_10445 [Sphingomonas sp. Leaf357]
MLAGLIFATDDADDRPGMLAATLPFGGLTLIEFQARLLVSAGVSQVIVVVARLTPELLGAIARIGRRGASVDVVRTATEAAEKLHPLARVLVVADGLVTTSDVMAVMAEDGGDALLTVSDRDASPGFERVGSETAWAGLARLEAKRIAEVAAMPKDYDFQSTLLRVAAQARARHIALLPGTAGGAHGIERDSRTLAERGNVILAALVSKPLVWADRYILAPLARLALPLLMARVVPSWAVCAAGVVLGLAALAAILFGLSWGGVLLAIVASLAFTIGSALAWLRDEEPLARFQTAAIPGVAALSALLIGHVTSVAQGTATGWTLAIALVVAAMLIERAAGAGVRRRWWGSPVAYLLTILPFVATGLPLIALAAAALYATVTLSAAIESIREKP